MSQVLNAPIAGQSLTDTPKNYPWERPAEITDPREAIKFHIDGLNEPSAIDNVLELIQMGIPLRALSKTALTTAQMEGIHSVDVSLIIGEVVYEELVSIAEEAGLDYKTGDEVSDLDVKEKEEQGILALLNKKLGAIEPGSDDDDDGVELMREVEAMMSEAMAMEEPELMQEQEEQMPMMEASIEEAPRGLMARG